MCMFHIYVNRETIKGGRTRLSLQGTFSYVCPPLYLYIHLGTLVLHNIHMCVYVSRREEHDTHNM